MKTDIHPAYSEMTATCSCGNVIKVGSTRPENIHIDVCSSCHPFYTGKQKVVDTGGRMLDLINVLAVVRSNTLFLSLR